MHDLLRLVAYVRPYWRRLAAAAGSAVLASVCYLALLGLVQPIVDEVLPVAATAPIATADKFHLIDQARGAFDTLGKISPALGRAFASLHDGSRGTAILVAVLMVVIFAFKGVFSYLTAYLTRWTGLQVVRDLRVDLYAKVQRQSLAFFSENSTGHLLSRILGDVGRLQRMVSGDLADILRLSAMAIGQAVWLFYLNWRFAGFCLVLLPIIVYPVARLGRRLRDASRGSMQRMGDASLVMKEGIAGTRIVQAFGQEQFEVDRFTGALDRAQRAEKKAARLVSIMPPVMETIAALGAALLFAYAAGRIAAGKLSAGEFVTFVAGLFVVFASIRNLVKINNDVQQGIAATRRVFEIMDLPRQVLDRPGAAPMPPFRERIEFRGVSFAYGKAPVLERVDLTVPRGRVVAIVGSSGAGKSTLVNLLPRFYDVTEGALLIDGRDVREVSLQSLRAQIGLVTQEVILFDDTVRNNIAYGRPETPEAAVLEAARAAYAHEFITALPRGYETPLGEAGHRLSQGQRQRISIARALLRNAPILILDEATSSLDSESEREVQAALDNLIEGRTVFVIAHRLATVRRADQILVLDRGRIVESGTHGDLLTRGGAYARLHDLQFRDEPPDARVSLR
ncbi:MAG TPA: ABC transporter ATP-binding protein [Candidatus Polarisedimenticolia bacterium]|nr:ABC transporter ATP-binding protein [Candidatus Polarisedimenticolia bacterium]